MTYILEEFGKQYYTNTVRFNLEADTRAKSMNQFRQTYHPECAIRISQKNFGLEEGIRSIPFNAVFCM